MMTFNFDALVKPTLRPQDEARLAALAGQFIQVPGVGDDVVQEVTGLFKDQVAECGRHPGFDHGPDDPGPDVERGLRVVHPGDVGLGRDEVLEEDADQVFQRVKARQVPKSKFRLLSAHLATLARFARGRQ